MKSNCENLLGTPSVTCVSHFFNFAFPCFLQFYLSLLGDNVPERLKSASEPFIRPLSSGQQSYTSSSDTYPVNEPLPRTDAKMQVIVPIIFLSQCG